jgi:hypothetical protein
MATPETPATVHLIVSDESEPAIKVKTGTKFEVHSVKVVDASLKGTDKIAARLCGGTSTCLALVKV